jgi:hypothetical protein
MALAPEHVIVMAGSYWHDYTDLGSGNPNPNAAQEEGYPTSNPFMCGSARLFLLADSHNLAPGAMVTEARSEHFVWLPKLIWLAYKVAGGSFGPLGQPTAQEQLIPSGIDQRFEHGEITPVGTTVRVVDQYGLAELAGPSAVTAFQKCTSRLI